MLKNHKSWLIGFIPFFLSIQLVLLKKFALNIGSWKKFAKLTGIILIFLMLAGWIIQMQMDIPFLKKQQFNDPESKELMASLLRNTYRAFDFRKESDVYDKLATSNDGDLLADIYIQTKQSMVLENQGGLQVKLNNVNIEEVEYMQKEDDGLIFRTRWEVEGDVGHWGHIHKRINKYDAYIKIKDYEGIWKMYDIDIIEEARII